MLNYCAGEFLGTLFLILLGDGAVASVLLKNSKGENAGWMGITTGWFIAVMVGVFVAQSAGSPNADINPCVSLAKYFLHIYSFSLTLVMMLAQLVGAFVGAMLVWLVYLPHWTVTEDEVKKLMVFSTVPQIRAYPSNLLCEIIASSVLILGIGAIFGRATGGGHLALGLAPYLVGVLIWGIGVSLGGPTGYAINPARDLGPRIAHAVLPIRGSSDWSYAWIPVLGPFLGSGVGAVVWKIFF